MKLSIENIEAWKKELNELMFVKFSYENYSATMSDEEWVEMYADETPDDVYQDELLND